jgi:undecaprenyl-diphosphatase
MVGYLIVISLKMLISRPRPYESYQDILEIFGKADPSFPSAHAFISFLSFYFLPTSFPKWAKTISALYLLIFIPIGSMYIGVHYPTDLIFGALLGVLVPFALQDKITNRLYKKIFK